jgi:NDP-sugar pyrophosphorylase family protein
MKAMILAAGFGTRLFPLTIDRTNRRFLFSANRLSDTSPNTSPDSVFKEVVVNLHHQPESVKKALGNGEAYGVEIHYTEETPDILGTAGALDNARHLLEDETFLIINGKIITDIDISAALETHRSSGALATMVLKPNTNREKFTIVETEGNLIKGFGDFPELHTIGQLADLDSAPQTPLMFTGIHILEPRVFDYIPRNVYSDIVPTFYRPAIERGEKIVAHVADGNWFELSTIPRYLDISLAMLDGQPEKLITGDNCRVSIGANVKDSVIWDDVSVEEGAELFRTIIADGVKIKSGERFENVAIVRAEMLTHCEEIPPKALKGFMQEENYVVPLNQ